jgi:hypothetical protein
MKRQVQIFATVLIGLLTAGPALAAVACTLNSMVRATSCPMGLAGRSVDCPMSHILEATDCRQHCCNRTLLQAVAIPSFPAKPRLLAITPDVALLTALPATEADSSPRSSPLRAATSPSRYILLRVFRI